MSNDTEDILSSVNWENWENLEFSFYSKSLILCDMDKIGMYITKVKSI